MKFLCSTKISAFFLVLGMVGALAASSTSYVDAGTSARGSLRPSSFVNHGFQTSERYRGVENIVGKVALKEQNGEVVRVADIDADGTFNFTGVAPGSYVLILEIAADDARANSARATTRSLPASRGVLKPVANSEWFAAEAWPYQVTFSGDRVNKKLGSIVVADRVILDRDTSISRKSAPAPKPKATIIEFAFEVTGNSNTNITGKAKHDTAKNIIQNMKG